MQSFSDYLLSLSLSEQTISAYTSSVRHYFSLFNTVSTENIQKYKAHCLSIHKPKTINLRLHAIAKYAQFAGISVEVKYIQIQEPLFAESLMTVRDYQKILSYLLDKGSVDWYCTLRLLACTGLRISESYQVTVGDIRNSTRKVILGKGTKTRVVWFPLKFRQEIEPLLSGRKDSEKIVCHDAGYIRSKLKRIQKTLGIKAVISPHEFRRFYARQVYAKSRDVYLVKDLLGHRSIQTTMRYLRVSVQSVSKRMSRLVDW